jgi:short subunit dehydrogenase-like uncharacterized protein
MKRKKNTYYSKVVLKESPYKKKQRQLNNYERLSDERNYMRARYNSMYNKHNSKKTAKSLKWGEVPVSYNCYISWKINKQKNDFPLQSMQKLLDIYESRFVKLEAIN